MRHRRLQARGGTERGTASVELIGVLPALLLVVLIAAQLVAAGYALWSAALAARAGARAELVDRDGAAAATEALPTLLRSRARVRDGDAVSVSVPVPSLLPGLPELRVGAGSSLRPQAPGG